MISIKTFTQQETINLARSITKHLKAGDCLAFFGDLGTGKSVFSRAIIQQKLGEDIHVPSPTFTLVQTYDQSNPEVWHLDLYRLDSPEDALELGIFDALQDCILLIEWAERLEDTLPPQAIHVEIKHGKQEDARIFTFKGSTAQLERLFRDVK